MRCAFSEESHHIGSCAPDGTQLQCITAKKKFNDQLISEGRCGVNCADETLTSLDDAMLLAAGAASPAVSATVEAMAVAARAV